MIKKRIAAVLLFLFLVITIAGAADTFAVINKTGYDIYFLNISPKTSDEWGDDILGDEVLLNDESIKLSIDDFGGDCEMDIQAIDEDDDIYLKWNVNTCETGKIVFTIEDLYIDDIAGSVQDFTLLNDTGYDIHYIYISPDYSDEWEEDILGEDEILPAGESYDISFAGYGDHCSFDVRMIDDEGDSYTKWGVDLCSTYTLTISLDDIDY